MIEFEQCVATFAYRPPNRHQVMSALRFAFEGEADITEMLTSQLLHQLNVVTTFPGAQCIACASGLAWREARSRGGAPPGAICRNGSHLGPIQEPVVAARPQRLSERTSRSPERNVAFQKHKC